MMSVLPSILTIKINNKLKLFVDMYLLKNNKCIKNCTI